MPRWVRYTFAGGVAGLVSALAVLKKFHELGVDEIEVGDLAVGKLPRDLAGDFDAVAVVDLLDV